MKTNKLKLKKQRSPQAGFLLVEIMVAVSVLSIGLLGMANMQLTGIKNNHSAMLRGEAAMYVDDISDRMRANIPGVAAGNYAFSGNTKVSSPANQAELDINAVLDRMTASHNDSSLIIACDATLAFVANCSITVSWEDSRATGSRQLATTDTGRLTNFTTNVFL
jgi:type IV pilus assembly protein PilV